MRETVILPSLMDEEGEDRKIRYTRRRRDRNCGKSRQSVVPAAAVTRTGRVLFDMTRRKVSKDG